MGRFYRLFLIFICNLSINQYASQTINLFDTISRKYENQCFEYYCLLEKIDEILEKSINFLINTQTPETTVCPKKSKNCVTQFAGEWPSYMEMKIFFPYLGGKSKVKDSNLFNTLAIHNSLYDILFIEPKWFSKIQPMTDKALLNILNYKNGCMFNFWNLLPPNKKLRYRDKKNYQPYVRRPTNFKLKTKFINNAANVTEDADDTSTSYLALWLRRRFSETFGITDTLLNRFNDLIYEPHEIFDQYRDLNRNNRHWMNYIYGDEHETGAYLTWLGEEYHFKKWKNWNMFYRLFVTLMHNMVFFAPISECFPFAYKPYIPYGSNDLCPVVNCNVLSCLAAYDLINRSNGADSAIKFVSKKIFLGNYDYQGIYYPNRFSLPYYSSEIYYRGLKDSMFIKSMNKLKRDVIQMQHPDGFWVSRKIVNKGDTIQSTVYAINTLLNIGLVQKDYTLLPNITNGIQWLLKKFHVNDIESYLNGGIFFTGGTVVRLHLCWTSDALTTALAAKSLVKYKKLLEIYISEKDKQAN